LNLLFKLRPADRRRCQAEERAGPGLLALQSEIAADCEARLGPRLEAALDDGDAEAAGEVLGELRGLRGRYEEGLKAARPTAKARRWLQVRGRPPPPPAQRGAAPCPACALGLGAGLG
jgi:hypothetical protein